MKQITLIIFFVLAFGFTKAQTGLQFSQVKLLNIATTSGTATNLGTVPAGKVWKLEQASSPNGSGYYLSTFSFRYNGSAVNFPIPYVAAGSSNNPTYFMSNNNPIWWPAGTVIDIYQTTGTSVTLSFSILEFTVVP